MVLIEEGNIEYLITRKVDKRIALMVLDKFLDCLGCKEKNVVWCEFEMKDLISEVLEHIYI